MAKPTALQYVYALTNGNYRIVSTTSSFNDETGGGTDEIKFTTKTPINLEGGQWRRDHGIYNDINEGRWCHSQCLDYNPKTKTYSLYVSDILDI